MINAGTDTQEILADVNKLSQAIQAKNIHVSSDLKDALSVFLADYSEEGWDQQWIHVTMETIKKYNPTIYQEYVDTLRKYKTWEKRNNEKEIQDIEKIQWKWEYIEKYKRDKEIATLLNQEYYGTEEWWFWRGFNGFYDEGDVVYACSTWKSKIFNYCEWILEQKGKEYYEIQPCGDYYLWTQVETDEKNRLIEWSQTYVLLDKKGNEIRWLRWYLSLLEKENVYRESYQNEWNTFHTYYDQSMKKLIDGIPDSVSLLARKDGIFLFQATSREYGESWKYIMIPVWGCRDGTYHSEDEAQWYAIYKHYQKKQDIKVRNQQQKEEILEETPLAYKFGWDDNGSLQYIDAIDGKRIFSGIESYHYKIKRPYDLSSSTYGDKRKTEAINQWIFLIQATSADHKYKKDIFINGNNGIIREFDDMPGYTFIEWQTFRHFINENDAEIYNVAGKKLGLQFPWDNNTNEYDYQLITNEEGKKQAVENKTWTIKWSVFNEVLKTYNTENEKVLVVRIGDKIGEIHINK